MSEVQLQKIFLSHKIMKQLGCVWVLKKNHANHEKFKIRAKEIFQGRIWDFNNHHTRLL